VQSLDSGCGKYRFRREGAARGSATSLSLSQRVTLAS
jgi:hypothetical protein